MEIVKNENKCVRDETIPVRKSFAIISFNIKTTYVNDKKTLELGACRHMYSDVNVRMEK